ncbi:IS1595 family transposase (plasmid) [Hymenobacter sp. NBH84]|uniref:IS1595 family transposase n=1 Tax=Hymenobacter sp. NBH84 TaxID=2596915 RepID=UPI001629E809|nr:IS1595 family transposase [Hymenobacter sp. NBH84]QNE38276.1 IS1595 family transposase [Hymenobacter sp. NBH84]QNE38614.1 IS1595 family transposase [Hymenobacter sp. NBH84]QNE38658.1 IS1595 family transposase [Hymenobacter sp. NBH84]QNE39137.1 IS1595 family transposase [Hymenobacter sp. NBH84]QNE39338.1 IS1595 family transposase [Hymenobacter sp. NBH84]
MQQTNRYYKCSKISEVKFRYLLRLFALDLTASDAARLTGLSVRAVNDIYLRLRHRLLACSPVPADLDGAVELDESYFGPRRVRGKRGRGAGGKTIVFGLFKRGAQVYTEIVPDCSKKTLQAIIRGKIDVTAMVNTDGWRGYDGLVDVGYDRHFRVHHGQNEFVQGASHINGIESFWSFAKAHLQRFKGVPNHTFLLHLKEAEFRFNHRHEDLYKLLLKLLRQQPL